MPKEISIIDIRVLGCAAFRVSERIRIKGRTDTTKELLIKRINSLELQFI
jgi:hypothetical protein